MASKHELVSPLRWNEKERTTKYDFISHHYALREIDFFAQSLYTDSI